MKTLRGVLVALAALAFGTTEARAQLCADGYLPDGEWAVFADFARVTHQFTGEVGGTDLGVGVRANPGPVALEAGYSFRAMESGMADVNVLDGSVSYEIFPVPLLPLPPTTAICARVGIGAAFGADDASDSDYTNLTVPLALAIGVPLAPIERLTVTPYVVPQYLLSSVDGQVLGIAVEASDAAFGVELGLGVRYGRVLGSASWFTAGLDPNVGTSAYPDRRIALRLGIAF